MPNWPISDSASCFTSSAASRSRKALVPERAIVPRPDARSSRLMPMPLSETVTVLASCSSAMVMAKGAPSATSDRRGDRFVAQLLAGVGGVRDELADEDLAVGIDRVNHEMQEARNVGLEALRRCGLAGRGRCVGSQIRPRRKGKGGRGEAASPISSSFRIDSRPSAASARGGTENRRSGRPTRRGFSFS